MLASSVIERAGTVITAKELKLYDDYADQKNDVIHRGDAQTIKQGLKTEFVKAFNEVFDEHLKDPKSDKKTAGELANHILSKTNAFTGQDVNI